MVLNAPFHAVEQGREARVSGPSERLPFWFVLHPERFVKPSGHKGKLSVNHRVVTLPDNRRQLCMPTK